MKDVKYGKTAEIILKRSVFRQLNTKNERVLSGAKIAGDSAILKGMSDKISVATSGVVDYTRKDREYYTFYKAFNNIAAGGGKPIAAVLNIIMPQTEKEKRLKEVVKAYDILCSKHGIEICGGHTQYTDQVNDILSSITMIGEQVPQFCAGTNRSIAPGMQIVMTKAIGIEGTAIIASEKEEILKNRFHGTFCDACLKFKEHISIEREAAAALANGALFMHDVSGAGVFGAIWEAASAFGLGTEVHLKDIPVWQETIELTELFDINPYKMASQGSLLIVTDDGRKMVDALSEQNISAAVIGKLVKGRDKTVLNEDEKRFLEPPRGDEIYKLNVKKESWQ